MPRMPSPPAAGRFTERPWRALSAPPDVLRVPTMLSEHELGLLYGLARDFADPDIGAVVDAGCFLGGSSAALLAGMRDRREPWTGPPVVSYDLFRVEEYELRNWFSHRPFVEVGHSFRSFYDRHVAGYPTPHRVLEGDITEIGWTGEPIHVFFVDVLKTAGVNRAVQRDFLPHLVPGESVLIHQDYGYGAHPYIHIGVELIADRLRPLDWMPHGSHVFLVEQELTADVVAVDPESLSVDDQFRLMDRAIARFTGDTRGNLEVAKATLVFDHFGAADALDHLADVRSRYGLQSIQTVAERTEEGFRMLAGRDPRPRSERPPAPPPAPAEPEPIDPGDDLLERRPWRTLQIPQALAEPVSPLADRERALLYVLAREHADPARGAVVCAGADPAALAALRAGLDDRAEPWTGAPVTAVGPADGWSGGPIGLLFVDGVDSWGRDDRVRSALFPHLVPGHSVIVHRGYGYGLAPWVHAGIALLGDALRPVDRVQYTAHAFLLAGGPPAAAAQTRLAALGPAERLRHVDAAIERLEGQVRGMAELGRAIAVADCAGLPAALDVVADVRRNYGMQAVQGCAERTLDVLLGAGSAAAPEGPARWVRVPEAGRAVVVVGTTAGGCAAVMRALEQLGAELGPDADRIAPGWLNGIDDAVVATLEQEHGLMPSATGWERDTALEPLRAQAREALAGRFADAQAFALGGARMGRTLPFWQPLLAERAPWIAYVLLVTDPAETVADDWLDLVTRALDATAGDRRLVLFADEARTDPEGTAARLAAHAGLPAPGPDAVRGVAAAIADLLAAPRRDQPIAAEARAAATALHAAAELRRPPLTRDRWALADAIERTVDVHWRAAAEREELAASLGAHEQLLAQATEVMEAAASERERLEAALRERG